MSATVSFLDESTRDALSADQLVEAREWERFKWLADRVEPLRTRYGLDELAQLLATPPTMPGQHEKVVVLLALDASPRALELLEGLQADEIDADLSSLVGVALAYARTN